MTFSKRRIPLSTLVVLTALTAGCGIKLTAGGNEVSAGDGKTEKYSYDFTENDCPTGKKSFSSKSSYCDSLKNDAANDHCARKTRYETFKRECPGNWN